MNNLYRNARQNKPVESVFNFDDEVLKKALKNIYDKDFHPMTDIEENLFNATWETMNKAADKGFRERTPNDPDYDFYQEIRKNNAVFSAFKVHRAQNDMAALLLDKNGNLKPFEQWLKEVSPIADHQVRHWLRTEYDTAVIRAHQAADWRQFEREKEFLPNLKWGMSTSVHPGADHKIFWGTIRPIDDPFWNVHRPGDRWNCKCPLTSTDEEPTPVPEYAPDNKPEPGLDNNPGKDAKLFGDTHPYIQEAHPGAKKAVDKLMKRIEGMIAEMPGNLTYETKMAIARHNIELEKALKITKGKPMNVEEADKQHANPNHGKERGYAINCQTCAPAYMLRCQGFDVTAKSNTRGSKLEYLSRGMNVWEAWRNIDGTPAKHTTINDWLAAKGYKQMTQKRYLQFFDETCKEEGIYELSIGWKGGGGHATILQRFANGELRYIEPQLDNSKGSGRESHNLDYLGKYGAANVHNCRGIMRIDDKLFNIDYIEIFDK